MKQGAALRAGGTSLLYFIPYRMLRLTKPREEGVFYITPRYIPASRGVLLLFDVSDYVLLGEQFVKNGVQYRLYLPVKGPQ